MTAGCQIFDGGGNLKLQIGDRLGRFVGQVYTGVSNGSFGIPGTNTGEPFFLAVPMDYKSQLGAGAIAGYPQFVLSGSTLSWTYPAADGQYEPNSGYTYRNIPHMVFIGVR